MLHDAKSETSVCLPLLSDTPTALHLECNADNDNSKNQRNQVPPILSAEIAQQASLKVKDAILVDKEPDSGITSDQNLSISEVSSIVEGKISIARPHSSSKQLWNGPVVEVFLLLGNIMVQRGIWEYLDDQNIPSYVSGLVGLVSFAISLSLENYLSRAKETTVMFTPRKYLTSATVLLSNVNIWRCLWNFQNEFKVPFLASIVTGTAVILLGMTLEQRLALRCARGQHPLHPHPPQLFEPTLAPDTNGSHHSAATPPERMGAAAPLPASLEPPQECDSPVADLLCKIRNR
jgi:hypothetical protein